MLSMLQQGILARAKEIVEEKDYTLLCKRANICPICGSGLIEDRAKKNEKRAALSVWRGTCFGPSPAPEKIATKRCVVHGFQW
jgi:hypothetical protein